jgi:regulator of sirC expression with transglutaminase-like and TPR domain
VISEELVQNFARLALSPDPDLAVAALMIARLEHPRLDAGPYIDRLEALGREAAGRVAAAADRAHRVAPADVDAELWGQITALNDFLFQELGFVGNETRYEDPRNSCLNEVLDRRTGIPITLALVYMEIARRAGVAVEGVNFPGHFLLRSRARRPNARDLIIDAFHGGALLSEDACRVLLRRHVGEEVEWDGRVLVHATKPQILCRMLVNLKRLYVRMHSYPQARDATELLLSVDPSAAEELRDRGLLAYHLNDFPRALRDLQSYLALSSRSEIDDEGRDEEARIWEHIKTIRRRVASLN